jgi:hypothetical protein
MSNRSGAPAGARFSLRRLAAARAGTSVARRVPLLSEALAVLRLARFIRLARFVVIVARALQAERRLTSGGLASGRRPPDRDGDHRRGALRNTRSQRASSGACGTGLATADQPGLRRRAARGPTRVSKPNSLEDV